MLNLENWRSHEIPNDGLRIRSCSSFLSHLLRSFATRNRSREEYQACQLHGLVGKLILKERLLGSLAVMVIVLTMPIFMVVFGIALVRSLALEKWRKIKLPAVPSDLR